MAISTKPTLVMQFDSDNGTTLLKFPNVKSTPVAADIKAAANDLSCYIEDDTALFVQGWYTTDSIVATAD